MLPYGEKCDQKREKRGKPRIRSWEKMRSKLKTVSSLQVLKTPQSTIRKLKC